MRERVVCLLIKTTDKPISRLAEACYRFSPQIAVRENEAVFIEIGGSLKLFNERTLLLRISTLAQRFECTPRIGFGNDAASALAMARFGVAGIEKLPLDALYDYACPFYNDELLSKKISRMIEALRKLGTSTIADFKEIPPKKLASRFGVEGSTLGMRVQHSLENKLILAWPRFRMPEMIEEKINLHDTAEFGPCSGLDPLLFVIKHLADRAMARLKGRGLRASTLEIELCLENYSSLKERSRKWLLELPVPQGSVCGILPILRERLGFDFSRAPLEAPVISVALKISETVPGHRLQRDFFNNRDDQAEAWDALVGRLCQKLGKDRAFLAMPENRYVPEKAWSRALEAKPEPEFLAEEPARPARVLNHPAALRREGNLLVFENKQWRPIEWQGPERLSGEWWSKLPLDRDYYRVVTESGEQLWVFLHPGRPELYLHGYFD